MRNMGDRVDVYCWFIETVAGRTGSGRSVEGDYSLN